jgi:hypothetical protein
MVTTEVGDLVFTMDVNGILLIPLCTVAGSKYIPPFKVVRSSFLGNR